MTQHEIDVDGGTMGCSLHPAEGDNRPGIVILHEIFGANFAMREVAERFAAQGYAVAVPDLFHRVERGVELGYTPDDRPRAMGLLQQIDLAAAVQDISTAVTWLRGRPEASDAVALMGFCLGGRLAILGADPSKSTASVAFYPVRMQDHRDVMQSLQTPTQTHLGDQDNHVPPDILEVVRGDLDRPPHRFHVYANAGHAFYNPHHPNHDAAQAAVAHEATLSFLSTHLGC